MQIDINQPHCIFQPVKADSNKSLRSKTLDAVLNLNKTQNNDARPCRDKWGHEAEGDLLQAQAAKSGS